MPTRVSRGERNTIHRDGERCQHAGTGVKGSPTVFDSQAKPWVQPPRASADEIAATIDTCPSGALTYTRTDGVPNGRRGYAPGGDAEAAAAADA